MKRINKNLIGTAAVVLFILGLGGPISAFALGPATVDLGTAGNFVIVAKSTVTSAGSSVVTGDIGLSPAAMTFVTGFSPTADPSNTFDTSAQVTGKIYAADFAPPTPAYMTAAVSAMEDAYTDAATRATPDEVDRAAGILGGQTFAPGLYKFSTGVSIAAASSTTLNGGANDVWIFQIAGDLTLTGGGNLSNAAKILLTGGAQAKNVFWQVAGGAGAVLGTYTTSEGNILTQAAVAMNTGAVLNGRALAQTAVTLAAGATPSLPAGASPATLRVVKLVVNVSANGGTAVPASFTLSVKNASTSLNVAGSPLAGVSAPGSPYSLSAGTYTVSETGPSLYAQSFTGACNSSGNVTLASGDDKTCTIVNTDTKLTGTSSGGGGARRYVPVIGILKVPTPLALPGGSGPVAYNYTVWNVGGQDSLIDVTVADDKCGPVVFLSGDVNNNSKLDPDERWKYSCTTTLTQTTTNTAIVTGYSDSANQIGIHQAAFATAIATVVVGASTPAPLINIVKVPSRLTPFPPGGGDVLYKYAVTNPGVVAMHDVTVVDDKCGPLSGPYGDANGNNLLDPGETWAYACQSNIQVSTRNVATASGKANGFTALGYAFATVLVAVPGLPNTGIDSQSIPLGTVVLFGFLVLASVSAVVLKRRRTI